MASFDCSAAGSQDSGHTARPSGCCPQGTCGLGVGSWAPDPPYTSLKGILAQSCFLPYSAFCQGADAKGPSEAQVPQAWLVGSHGPRAPTHTSLSPHPPLWLGLPRLPQDTHSPHAWPHPLGPGAPQPTYKQTPEGLCQQHACQRPSRWPRAVVYGPRGHPRGRLLSVPRTGRPLEGAPRRSAGTVGGQCPSDSGATFLSPVSYGIGTHSGGAKHLHHRGHTVPPGLAEGPRARGKLWHVSREVCNEAKGRSHGAEWRGLRRVWQGARGRAAEGQGSRARGRLLGRSPPPPARRLQHPPRWRARGPQAPSTQPSK